MVSMAALNRTAVARKRGMIQSYQCDQWLTFEILYAEKLDYVMQVSCDSQTTIRWPRTEYEYRTGRLVGSYRIGIIICGTKLRVPSTGTCTLLYCCLFLYLAGGQTAHTDDDRTRNLHPSNQKPEFFL